MKDRDRAAVHPDEAVALGERAKAIAQAAPPEHRKHYLLIADEWLKLAMEMENAASKEAGRD